MSIFDSIGKPNIEKLEARQDCLGLVKALLHKDREVKNAAVEALVRIGAPAVETVIGILEDDELRRTAMDILGRIGDRRATESILFYLNQKPSDKVYDSHFSRRDAATALGKIGDPRAAGDLVKALDDEHFEVIDEAYIALRDMGLPAGDYLLPALKSEKPVLRLLAAELLGKIKDARAYDALIELLRDENMDVRKAAAEALGRLENPDAIPALTELIRDEFAVSREAAFEAVWKMGKPVLQTLVDALEEEPEPYWGCRKFACEQLGKIDDPAVVMPVLKHFSKIEWDKYTHSSWLREEHSLLLGILNRLCIQHNRIFTEALSGEDVRVRHAAAAVLGTEKISLAFTFSDLEKMMESGDVELQLRAIRSLREFPAEFVSQILTTAAKIQNPQVVKAAEEALFWVQHQ